MGDVQWTITNAYSTGRLASNFGRFGDSKQGNFVVVDAQSMALLDSEGRESQADSDSIEYVSRDRNIFLEQGNHGVTEQGSVIFTGAPGSSGFRLQVGDATLFSYENGYIDLGF